MIIIHADLKIQAGKEHEFLQAVKPLVEGSQAEKGCVRYTLMQLCGDSSRYTFVEEWKDQEAVALHNVTEHFQAFGKQASAFVEGEMKVKKFFAPEEE